MPSRPRYRPHRSPSLAFTRRIAQSYGEFKGNDRVSAVVKHFWARAQNRFESQAEFREWILTKFGGRSPDTLRAMASAYPTPAKRAETVARESVPSKELPHPKNSRRRPAKRTSTPVIEQSPADEKQEILAISNRRDLFAPKDSRILRFYLKGARIEEIALRENVNMTTAVRGITRLVKFARAVIRAEREGYAPDKDEWDHSQPLPPAEHSVFFSEGRVTDKSETPNIPLVPTRPSNRKVSSSSSNRSSIVRGVVLSSRVLLKRGSIGNFIRLLERQLESEIKNKPQEFVTEEQIEVWVRGQILRLTHETE